MSTTIKHDTLTGWLAQRALQATADSLPDDTLVWAQHSLMDWLSLVAAGWRAPDVQRLLTCATRGATVETATSFGNGQRCGMEAAVLVNGTAGHILDFDDAHLKSRVHPAVPLWPAIMAYAEREALSGRQALAAFVAGVEVQSRLARVMGESHYRQGWHNTATLGAFGAAAAISRLKALDHDGICRAFGIVASLASGMHKAFGSAVKPFQVARASANGLLAAELAETGFNAPLDVLDGETGYARVHAAELHSRAIDLEPDHWAIRDIVFKYHASCYGTQAPVEAALRFGTLHRRDIADIVVAIEPQYMSVCNIADPKSDTQAKFSIKHMVALALAGYDTADSRSYSKETLDNPELKAWRERIQVQADAEMKRACARVDMRWKSGERRSETVDASQPERDLGVQSARLTAKSRALLTEAGLHSHRITELQQHMHDIAHAPSLTQWAKDYGACLAKALR
ncbi:MmgE/PrpD family protein [Bordetella sp. 15P40C-2]|uniref:MmgE/PrpD family protein n=1 Tax=Bordetella sp. 15P40C-2 TaxID=2572246 RepID=UPI001366519E